MVENEENNKEIFKKYIQTELYSEDFKNGIWIRTLDVTGGKIFITYLGSFHTDDRGVLDTEGIQISTCFVPDNGNWSNIILEGNTNNSG